MLSHSEKLKKEIQKIIYEDLEVWKQHINDLNTKKIDVNTFKKHYVEFLQKIEENITQFTLFFLKKESHKNANLILEDDLEKTALLETITQFLSVPIIQKEKEMVIEAEIIKGKEGIEEKEVIIHRKFAPTLSSSALKKEKPLLYRASEVEYIN